jgi:hypothetical protein
VRRRREQFAAHPRQHPLHRLEVQAAAGDVGRAPVSLLDRPEARALPLRAVDAVERVALGLEHRLLRLARARGITLLYSARASLIIRSRCCCAWLTSSHDGLTGSGGLTSCSTTCSIVIPISYCCVSARRSSSARVSIAWRPTVSTSVTVRSPTTCRITASFIARKVSVTLRTLKRYLYGSATRYWTIHSTTATLRSPVSITASAL